MTYYYARQYSPAIDQLHKTIDTDPRFPLAHLYLGLCYEQLGKFQEAISEFQKGLELGENPWFTASLIHAYGRSGRQLEARQQLKELLQAAKTKFVSPYFVATAYTGVDKDQAFQWLETAYRDRVDWMTYLRVDPGLDPLRADPRFVDLLRHVGLAPWAQLHQNRPVSTPLEMPILEVCNPSLRIA